MKTASRPSRGSASSATIKKSGGAPKIHPVIIYPFRQPRSLDDLDALYELVARFDENREAYARPLTVMDRKTYYAAEANRAFRRFREETVARRSDILDAWCVDTCQMWYTGLGQAFERGKEGDVYWLIPGDFDYGSGEGQQILGRLHDLPEIVAELDQDVCIGEIAMQPTHSKQLIDTYGTFALLYNWFPKEAAELRETVERPRSEFFALRHDFMREVLRERWYAYEQTVILLLRAIASRRRVSRFAVGHLSDLPEGRESLSAAVQQVERMERVLRSHWRESHQNLGGWAERYRALDAQSEQIRRTATTVLQNLLK